MDGTDQLPFGLPSFNEIFKKEKCQRMMHHELVAVIDHGPERKVVPVYATDQIPFGVPSFDSYVYDDATEQISLGVPHFSSYVCGCVEATDQLPFGVPSFNSFVFMKL